MAEQDEEETSKLINVREFQEKWSQLVDFSSERLEKKLTLDHDIIAQDMDLPVQTVKDLSAVCSVTTLLAGCEPDDKELYYKLIPDTSLKTLQYQSQELLKRKESTQYRQYIYRTLRYNHNNTIRHPTNSEKRGSVAVEKCVPTPNIILTVDLYRQSQLGKSTLLRDQMVLVHGDMFLSELRDSIHCVNDLAIAGDFSPNLETASHVSTSQEMFKSGFFYMEEIFYNDTRHEDNRDYSKLIIDWMNKSGKSSINYKTYFMEAVQFKDLSIRLGEPYLYMHQGNCEHVFSFSDLRMLDAEDSHSLDNYPFVVSQYPRRRNLCKSCMMYTARWQIEESKLTPIEPTYLCESCLNCLHYDQHGNKVGQFKAFKFADAFSSV